MKRLVLYPATIMRAASIVTLIAIALAGCTQEAPIPLALSAAPFHMLRDIALGMPAKDLETRHTVTFKPYQGYVEDAGGYIVLYGFGDLIAEKPPGERARLESVTVTETDATSDAALLRYTRSVLEATRMFGVPPECGFHEASRGMITQYSLTNALYVIVYVPGDAPAIKPSVTRSVRQTPHAMWMTAKPQRCVR